MIKVELCQIIIGTPETKSVTVEIPALPPVGAHISHEPSGVNGYVEAVTFYWPENDEPLEIVVRLK